MRALLLLVAVLAFVGCDNTTPVDSKSGTGNKPGSTTPDSNKPAPGATGTPDTGAPK